MKCENNLRLIFEDILGFTIKPLSFDQSKLHKRELITTAKKIEGRLYERIFSYFPPMTEKEQEDYLAFTAKHLLLKEVESKIDQLASPAEDSAPGTPISLCTPSKLPLRRTNSAFKQHVSVKKQGQCRPLALATDTSHNSKPHTWH